MRARANTSQHSQPQPTSSSSAAPLATTYQDLQARQQSGRGRKKTSKQNSALDSEYDQCFQATRPAPGALGSEENPVPLDDEMDLDNDDEAVYPSVEFKEDEVLDGADRDLSVELGRRLSSVYSELPRRRTGSTQRAPNVNNVTEAQLNVSMGGLRDEHYHGQPQTPHFSQDSWTNDNSQARHTAETVRGSSKLPQLKVDSPRKDGDSMEDVQITDDGDLSLARRKLKPMKDLDQHLQQSTASSGIRKSKNKSKSTTDQPKKAPKLKIRPARKCTGNLHLRPVASKSRPWQAPYVPEVSLSPASAARYRTEHRNAVLSAERRFPTEHRHVTNGGPMGCSYD